MAKGWTEKEGVDDMMRAYETFGDATTSRKSPSTRTREVGPFSAFATNNSIGSLFHATPAHGDVAIHSSQPLC